MTDRNDGRPRHSASHTRCAVPFFLCPKRNGRGACRCAGAGEGLRRGRCCEVGEECIAQSAGVHRRCVEERKCSGRACRCAGTGAGLRRGMGCEGGEECIAQPAGVHRCCVGERACSGRACRCAWVGEGLRRGRCCEGGEECIAQSAGVHRRSVGERKCSGRACRCAGAGEGLRRGTGREDDGNASRSRRACIGAAWGSGSARGGRVAVRGRAKTFGGERVVRAASLTHIRRSGSRARIYYNIRPPVHAVKSQPWDRKGVPAFTLPPHRLRRHPRSNRPPAAVVIHNGLSTEKLSTSLLAALCKTFSPSRLCTRIYNIGFALAIYRVRPRAVVAPRPAPPCAGWGRAEDKGGRTLVQCRPMPLACRAMLLACRAMPLVVPNNAACVPNHAACVPNNAACVPNHAACVPNNVAGVPNHCAQRRKYTRPTPPRPVRFPRGSWSTAAPPPPKWEPRLRRREGKRPNGAPPHHNAHTPNAERKRYLHNSRTKMQRRTKRCAQFVIFIFTLCKLLHNFSTVLHRSPRNLPKRAQIAARRPDLPCFTFPSRAGTPKIVMKNRPTSAPIEPRKPPRFAPAPYRARTLASAGRGNTP